MEQNWTENLIRFSWSVIKPVNFTQQILIFIPTEAN